MIRLKPFLALSLVMVVAVVRIVCYCKFNLASCAELGRGKQIEDHGVLWRMRNYISEKNRTYLPSPQSELLEGMVFGIDNFDKLPRFNDVLKSTGTVHVVVVSGYNISLVINLIFKFLGSKYQLKNLITAECISFVYAVFSGFEPPVIRAWIMGSIVCLSKYYGRSINVVEVLMFAGAAMVIISPSTLFSLSFQLSFLATLSLVTFQPFVLVVATKMARRVPCFTKLWLFEDLVTTFAAQILVWPLISMNFGRVSLISLVVNPLILWTVPLATILGGVYSLASLLSPVFASPMAFVAYIPLDIFVLVVEAFGQVPFASVDFELSEHAGFLYYGAVFALLIWFKKAYGKKT